MRGSQIFKDSMIVSNFFPLFIFSGSIMIQPFKFLPRSILMSLFLARIDTSFFRRPIIPFLQQVPPDVLLQSSKLVSIILQASFPFWKSLPLNGRSSVAKVYPRHFVLSFFEWTFSFPLFVPQSGCTIYGSLLNFRLCTLIESNRHNNIDY